MIPLMSWEHLYISILRNPGIMSKGIKLEKVLEYGIHIRICFIGSFQHSRRWRWKRINACILHSSLACEFWKTQLSIYINVAAKYIQLYMITEKLILGLCWNWVTPCSFLLHDWKYGLSEGSCILLQDDIYIYQQIPPASDFEHSETQQGTCHLWT